MRELMIRIVTAALIAVTVGGVLVACESGPPGGETANNESAIRDGGYDVLARNQPAATMPFSPTRETINGWVQTWGKPGKVSYVYLQNADGKMIGYFVLKGLPVSYCSANTPNYKIWQDSSSNGNTSLLLPAPGLDGTYEASGAACNTFYGFDAGTGAYVEYTAGLGINVLLYDAPLPQSGSIPPLGPTSADKAPSEPVPAGPNVPAPPATPGAPR